MVKKNISKNGLRQHRSTRKECAKLAANLAFKLVTYLIFLNFSNQFLSFRVFTGIVKHNIYKDSFGLNADGSIPKIYESIFLRQRVYVHRTKSESKFEV